MASGKYTVNEVEERTKVPASTLRQWERRYGFPKPERSDAGYRMYSEQDLGHINAMKRHIADGIPASRAAELVKGLRPVAGGPRPVAELREELLAALLGLDEARADEALSEAHALHTVETVVLQVVAGALKRIGELWREGALGVTTEHFASSYLQGRLRGLLGLTPNVRTAPAVIVACAPDERHEFGALMLAIFLRRAGYRTYYLGPDTPVDDLAAMAGSLRPLAVLISATGDQSLQRLDESGQQLRGVAPVLGFGGAAFNRRPQAAAALGGIHLGHDVPEGLRGLERAVRALEAA